MNKLLMIGAGIGFLMFAGAKKAGASSSTVNAYQKAIQAMKVADAATLITITDDKAFDAGTKAALKDEAQRILNAQHNIQNQPTPLLLTGGIDLANNEFSAKLMGLEGDVAQLRAWATAYQPIYPAVSQALMVKVQAIQALNQPAPPAGTAVEVHPSPPAVSSPPVIPLPSNVPGGLAIPPMSPPIVPSGDGGTAIVDPKYTRAMNMATMLSHSSRYKEDKSMVQAFQAENGMKPDGQYGVGSGLRLAAVYNIVPPKPFYFNKKTAVADKKAYKAAMIGYANSDPSRYNAWIEASKVDNL
jgi:murein L,D-transpeptidase YcbB/YkuD